MPPRSSPTKPPVRLEWVESTVTITKASYPSLHSDSMEVKASTLAGVFALYPTMDKYKVQYKFTLAHIPSGCMRILYGNEEGQLRRIALLLARNYLEIFRETVGKKVKAKLPENVRKWIDECVNKHGWVDLPQQGE